MKLEPLDHGVLNVPLSKRGNIDSQLIKYTVEQNKIKHNEFQEIKNRKVDAIKLVMEMYKALTTAQLRVAAKKHNSTVTEMRMILKTKINAKPDNGKKLVEYVIGLSEE